ncbi:MAG: hypothetical protein ACTSYJ_10625 [Candidatus Thorarchaeota archaeon]
MQRKRVVLISILAIVLAIPLVRATSSVGCCTPTDPCYTVLAQDNFTINCSSEPITWCKDSKVNLIIWTITNTHDTITFDVLRNGTVEYSGTVENNSFLQYVPVFCSVPLSEMDFGTYNYTLVAKDSVETKSATVILDLIEGHVNTANPLFDVFVFITLIGGFTVLFLAIFFGVRLSQTILWRSKTH